MKKQITWQELWLKCIEPEKKLDNLSNKDKCYDWDLERVWYEKNKNLK